MGPLEDKTRLQVEKIIRIRFKDFRSPDGAVRLHALQGLVCIALEAQGMEVGGDLMQAAYANTVTEPDKYGYVELKEAKKKDESS